MENEVKQRNLQRNRRRERAQRMQAQRESKVKDGDSGEDESPAREKPARPPPRRKKSREPLAEEDIIDGFAIMAFRTYEDLEAAVKCASSPRTNALSTKPRLPLAALASDTARNHPSNNVNSHGITLLQDAGTSDDSGRASERLTGSSVAPRDPDSSRDRLSDCDSEGDDDKASPENSRNASPRYHDVSMEDASDAGSLFRVSGAAGGGGGKNELVARGGSGGALALSRAPVGGSASPAPAPLPQPAPSPAPAALPPPALPPPHRPNGAHIPTIDQHANTHIPAKPVGAASGPDTPDRPAANTTKLQPGARAAADSPTPAPPAPPATEPLFPTHAAYQSQSHAAAVALPDYRHTNHETRTEKPVESPAPPPPAQAPAPLDLHAHHAPRPPPPPHPAPAPRPSHAVPQPAVADVEMRSPAAPTTTQSSSVPTSFPCRANGVSPVTAPHSVAPTIPTCLPSQTLSGRAVSPAAPTSRPYPAPAIGSSHVNSSMSSSIHGHAMPFQSQASLQKHSAQSVYASRPSHLAPFGVPGHMVASHLHTSAANQPTPSHASHAIHSHSIASHAAGHHALSHPSAMPAPLTHLGPLPLPPAMTSSGAAMPSYSSTLKHPGLGGLPIAPLPPPVSMHVDLTTSSSNSPVVAVTSAATSNIHSLAPPVVDSRQSAAVELPARTESPAIVSSGLATNGYPPPVVYAGTAYPPLYAPYATTLQHSPYLPPAAASPRNSADTRTSLSASPLVAPKTPKGVRPHTPGSTGAAGAALTSYSPGPSPTRERESFSNISSLSRSTPASNAPVSSAPLAPSLVAPLPGPLPAPIPNQVVGGAPLVNPLVGPLVNPLAGPLTTPLAAPTPTPAAPTSAHLAHSMAPVPTVPSISSSAKPPAHWGVTPSPAEGPRGFAPAPPLFGAPLAPPPNPNPFSAESLFNTSPGADLLRRELDNRFLAVAGAAGAASAGARTEMHHHQHQHTHVHQHPPAAPPPPPPPHHPHHPALAHHPHHLLHPHPPLFKDVSKMPSLYRSSMGLGYPYSSSLLHPPSPYVPPTPLSYAPAKPVVTAANDSAPKPPQRSAGSKTGKWNAMHVRIAWEIYNHQHKDGKPGGAPLPGAPPGGGDKDKIRAFSGAPPPPPPAAYRSPYELPAAHYLPHPHLARYEPGPFHPERQLRVAGVSPFARYGPAAYPGAPPSFQLSAYGRELALSSSLHPVHHAPLPPMHDPWRTAPRVTAPPPQPPPPSHEERERERARRDREERERRDREERERRKAREQRDRDLERARTRSPLRNGVLEPKEERKEIPRHPHPHAGPPGPGPPMSAYPPPPPGPGAWDPYRAFDPLQHMRFAPLVEAAIRAEEDRAKMLSAYAHHQQMKAGPMARGPPMSSMPQLGAHGMLAPLDLLKKEEPR